METAGGIARGGCAILLMTGLFVGSVGAGVTVYEKGDKRIEVGGRIQLQYRKVEQDSEETFDKLFFRRLRPYILGTVTKDWLGKIQFDFGESEDDDEVKVKDAYIQFLGLEKHKVYIGNAKAPYSREFLASSKRQQLIERSFGGSHNFGSPERQLGLRIDGHARSRKITYAGSVGVESHDPAVERMDFDSPVNNESDWNEGWLVAGRIDFHPLGFMTFDQADFHTEEWKFNVSLAAFTWTNDEDVNTLTDPNGVSTSTEEVDLDSANGFEISSGLRGKGFSVDAEYQMVSGDTVDPDFTGGLYRDGTTDLDILALEGGYVLPRAPVEFVVGWDSLDADDYESAWKRTSVGVNWYWNKHKAKVQTTYRMSENFLGEDGEDLNEIIAQIQFVF